jgi:phosphate transport system substrate-binding protein
MKIAKNLVFTFAVLSLISCNMNNKCNMLRGSGATFPYPLYHQIFLQFYQETNIKVEYAAIGSGAGINNLVKNRFDFAASDCYMDAKLTELADETVLHFPTFLSAVVISYNLPGNPQLNLSSELIAKIFLQEIEYWNDEHIRTLNPDIQLPEKRIIPVFRSDASGTSYIFSDYLCSTNALWASKVSKSQSLNHLPGKEAKGNGGVAHTIKNTPSSIGYLELKHATDQKMPIAKVRNKCGNFIYPDNNSISAAANLSHHFENSFLDTPAADGYPLSSFSWLVIRPEKLSMSQKFAFATLIEWMIGPGQIIAVELDYPKLPSRTKEHIRTLLDQLLGE